jgi:hypothetical protein
MGICWGCVVSLGAAGLVIGVGQAAALAAWYRRRRAFARVLEEPRS